MLRKISINLFSTAVVVSFLALVGLLILLPNNLSAQQEKLKRAFPVEQCIKLSEGKSLIRIGKTENLSIKAINDDEGCIKDESVTLYKTADCSGEGKEFKFPEKPKEDLVYKSGIDGGCPEAIEVKHGSPTCVTVTLKSGREAEICW